MIDVLNEDLIRVADVPSRLPCTRKGKCVHHASVFRWYKDGVRGVKLETIIVSGERFTSTQALQRFFAAQTEARDSARDATATTAKTPAPRSPAARRRSNRDAERALIQRGA